MKSKFIAALFLTSLLLSACAGQPQESEQKETFTVGMECGYAPFNYQVANSTDTSAVINGGYCDGYDVVISRAIAEKIGRELVVKKIAWNGLGAALEAGEIDAIVAGMTANEEREKGIDFTSPYYDSHGMIMIVRKDSDEAAFTNVQQYVNSRVVGQVNTNYDDVIDQIEGIGKNHVTPKATYPEMVVALQQNDVDAITAEMAVAQDIIATNPDLTVVRFEEGQGFDCDTTVSIGLREGSRGSELYNQVENALASIDEDTRNEWMMQAALNQPSEPVEELNPQESVQEGMRIDLAEAWKIFQDNIPSFVHGIYITVLFAVVGTLGGFLLGLLIGGCRTLSDNKRDNSVVRFLKKFLNLFSRFYIWVLRGTPMMVQAVFFYYLLKPALNWNHTTAGLVVISINTGAYMAEIIRSGIQSIDKGQTEAAKAIGLTTWQTMRHIILPQAVKNSFPSIGNQLIVNIKDSSMLNVLSITELYFQSYSIAGSNYRFIETYLVTAVLYLVLTTIASAGLNLIEKKMNVSGDRKDYCA